MLVHVVEDRPRRRVEVGSDGVHLHSYVPHHHLLVAPLHRPAELPVQLGHYSPYEEFPRLLLLSSPLLLSPVGLISSSLRWVPPWVLCW